MTDFERLLSKLSPVTVLFNDAAEGRIRTEPRTLARNGEPKLLWKLPHDLALRRPLHVRLSMRPVTAAHGGDLPRDGFAGRYVRSCCRRQMLDYEDLEFTVSVWAGLDLG